MAVGTRVHGRAYRCSVVCGEEAVLVAVGPECMGWESRMVQCAWCMGKGVCSLGSRNGLHGRAGWRGVLYMIMYRERAGEGAVPGDSGLACMSE